jgi:hypothetical protein
MGVAIFSARALIISSGGRRGKFRSRRALDRPCRADVGATSPSDGRMS